MPSKHLDSSPSSFRDPAGYVFLEGATIKRAVMEPGRADYEALMGSGLYDELTAEGLLIPHQEESGERPGQCWRVIVPRRIRCISYPYEWCFGQLRDAALLTLRVQQKALKYGMSLKDASGFNIQFVGPRPVFIDTLSFERNTGGPWVAYGQFCTHFLGPLALMSQASIECGTLLRGSVDGLPLDVVSCLLPRKTLLRFGLLTHIHLHARAQRSYAEEPLRTSRAPAGRDPKGLIADSLANTVKGLRPKKDKTEWADYYAEAKHYSSEAEAFKAEYISKVAADLKPSLVYDLGGNTGNYSRIVTRAGIDAVCYDKDPVCVNRNYELSKTSNDEHMLPLIIDLSNPTPALGVNLEERSDFFSRARPDLLLALALVHHLRIGANIPVDHIVRLFSKLGPNLVLEFVPREDPLAQRLVRNREGMFQDYDFDALCAALERTGLLLRDRSGIPGTLRSMCLFGRR